jgi:hypothetical protein
MREHEARRRGPRHPWVKRRWAILVAISFMLIVFALMAADRWWRTLIAATGGGLTIVVGSALIRMDELMTDEQRKPRPAQVREATRIGILALIVVAATATIAITIAVAVLR